MTGTEFSTAATEINGGASIGSTFLFQLGNLGKNLIEQRRPWMLLRKTDTSKTATTVNTWQTAIDLSTITDFNRFYGSHPIRLFDGSNRIEKYRLVPFEERLRFKDTSGTACYDAGSKTLYLNGTVNYAGTLYIRYIRSTASFTSASDTIWVFPDWSHLLIPMFAVGLHKGGVDFDDINARMAPENRAVAELTVKQLENWDNELQQNEIEDHDPTIPTTAFGPTQ